ncbi:MAG: PIN domain nuclease, partial [Thermoanaerobaculia bacterium]|nr:PIN domain nuclease [Thermoanaerobaculia bacterium]
MILVDTPLWVAVLRDASHRPALEAALAGADAVLTRFTQMELLQGARDEAEWDLLSRYLESQDYVETSPETWEAAVRIQFD